MNSEVRFCALAECGQPIGPEMRSDAKYHSSHCRTRASEIRLGKRAENARAVVIGEPLSVATLVPWAIIAISLGAALSVFALG